MQTYEEIHQLVKENVGWDVPIYKLKFIYSNAEWQQVQPDADLFNNYSLVDTYCSSGDLIHDTFCTMDYSFWSALKQTKPTEDVYQFIDFVSQSLKTEIHHEISSFHFNWDGVLNFIDIIGEVLFLC